MTRARRIACAVVLAAIGAAGAARAQPQEPPRDQAAAGAHDDPAALFGAAVSALQQARTNDAIADFEALGDRGVIDAVASYDRGLAYAQRVRQGAEVPGDLGRAAHGFEEARELSRDDALTRDATRALSVMRAEVARRRAEAGEPIDVDTGVPLRRAIARLLPENAWYACALVASTLLGAALFVRSASRARRVRIGAAIALSVAGPVLVATTLLALIARDERLHLREGVIVAPSARLADDRHVAIAGAAPLPEALRVVILDASGGWTKVQTAGTTGWIPSPAVREIVKPE